MGFAGWTLKGHCGEIVVYKEWLFLEKLLLSGSKIYGRKLSSYDFSGHLFFFKEMGIIHTFLSLKLASKPVVH